MNKQIFEIGMAGLGRIGWHHAESIRKTTGLKLVAICDNNTALLKKAKKEFKSPVFSSYQDMLSNCKADIITIAVPSHLHYAMAIKAIKKGFNVLIEKPIAANASEARRMKEAADKAGKWVTVNQSFRYRPDVQYLKKIIQSGKIGQVFQIDLCGGYNFSERKDWQIWQKHNGGMLSNWGVHLVDAILYIIGDKPVSVLARLNQILDRGDTEDCFKIIINFENKSLAEVEMLRSFYGKYVWHICGTKGSIQGELDSSVLNIKTRHTTGKRVREISKKIDFTLYPSQTTPHYKDLLQRLRTNQGPPVTIESVMRTMSVLDAARKSNRMMKTVTVYSA